MEQNNFEESQALIEQFEPEMSLKAICEQEGVSYRSSLAGGRIMDCASRGRKDPRRPD